VPTRYVLDASAGVDILQHTAEGEALAPALRASAEVDLWTVEHFHVEVAKVFRRDVLRGVLNDDQATQLTAALAGWPLEVVSVAPLLEEAWQLRHNVTVHDALYVVLTRHLPDAALVSTDRRLSDAPGVDIPVITPDQLLS
jgi:predicted nucleic acid-binding protein